MHYELVLLPVNSSIFTAAVLEPLYPATKVEPCLADAGDVRALLLSVWCDLSGVKLAQALDDGS
tara:strand:+ start:641 stop:832 length:192 start_codon:yes stop_codon:yes gene_type:complete